MIDPAKKQADSETTSVERSKLSEISEIEVCNKAAKPVWGIDVRRSENIWQAKVLGVFMLVGTLIGAAVSPQINENAPRLMGALLGAFSGLVLGWFYSGWCLMVHRPSKPRRHEESVAQPNRSPAEILFWGIVESVCLSVVVVIGVIWEVGVENINGIFLRDDVGELWLILAVCCIAVLCKVGVELIRYYRGTSR